MLTTRHIQRHGSLPLGKVFQQQYGQLSARLGHFRRANALELLVARYATGRITGDDATAFFSDLLDPAGTPELLATAG